MGAAVAPVVGRDHSRTSLFRAMPFSGWVASARRQRRKTAFAEAFKYGPCLDEQMMCAFMLTTLDKSKSSAQHVRCQQLHPPLNDRRMRGYRWCRRSAVLPRAAIGGQHSDCQQ